VKRCRLRGLVFVLCALALVACEKPVVVDLSGPTSDWPEYGHDKGGMRYSPLTQITPANVGALKIA